jgi:hypothetical protein
MFHNSSRFAHRPLITSAGPVPAAFGGACLYRPRCPTKRNTSTNPRPSWVLRAIDGNQLYPLGCRRWLRRLSMAELGPLWNVLVRRLAADPDDAAALMDLSTIAHLQGRAGHRIALQAAALDQRQIYRQLPAVGGPNPMRLLAFVAPGDFLANNPVEFLLEGSGVNLDMVYVLLGASLPEVPEHDIAMIAVAQTDENGAILSELSRVTRAWPRPVINAADQIARLTRTGAWQLLKRAPGVVIPVPDQAVTKNKCRRQLQAKQLQRKKP